MIEFWTNPMSRGQIAHWMLEELGQPYTTNWLDWGPGGNKRADFLAINPMGKVPTICHDGKVVTEAAAIILYLADAFPQAKLKPKGPALADYYRTHSLRRVRWSRLSPQTPWAGRCRRAAMAWQVSARTRTQ